MTGAGRFEAFVREYQDMVFATAVRLLGNAAEAEDASQTVFLKAFEHFATVGASPSAAGWLKTVTINHCLNHLARYRRRWTTFSDLDAGRNGHGPSLAERLPAAGSPATELEETDRRHSLERALRALPDSQRVPIVLFHFDDMSYEAIAARLGVSLGKIKTDIHRGREALRRALAGEIDGPA
jgi:RNA polymerase sigma-70 factor (ECF subfamily)